MNVPFLFKAYLIKKSTDLMNSVTLITAFNHVAFIAS
jgi:hypothetical protein